MTEEFPYDGVAVQTEDVYPYGDDGFESDDVVILDEDEFETVMSQTPAPNDVQGVDRHDIALGDPELGLVDYDPSATIKMLEPRELVKYFQGKMSEDEIRDEQVKLSEDLNNAEAEIRGAAHLQTSAVLRLEEIRASGRFRFGYKTWDACLQAFIDGRGIGPSSMKKWLKVARMWKHLGRELPQLLEYADGVKTIEPILDGGNKIVNGYNASTGEITSITKAWKDDLEGETPKDQVNAFIDTIQPEMTKRTVTSTLKLEKPKPDTVTFNLIDEAAGSVEWTLEEEDGTYHHGFIYIRDLKKMHRKAFARLCQKLKL